MTKRNTGNRRSLLTMATEAMEPAAHSCDSHSAINRRTLITGLCACSAVVSLGGCAANTANRQSFAEAPSPLPRLSVSGPANIGCCLVGSSAQTIIEQLNQQVASGQTSESLIMSSGDERLDRAFGILLADIAGKFNVRPGFAFYDDGNSPNALALSLTRMPGTSGTVLFGRSLLTDELKHSQYGDMPVMAVCAHEFGHIVQFQQSIQDRLSAGQPTQKRVELHADFLAGYYVGRRGIDYGENQLIALGKTWEGLGDSNFTDPSHHGTREERIAAVEAGYMMATESQASLTEAVQGGLYYLRA